MGSPSKTLLGFALFVLLLAGSPARAVVFGVGPFFGANLYAIDEATGTASLIAPLSDPNLGLAGIEFDGNGRLLGIDSFRLGGGQTRKVWQINTMTGAVTPLFDLSTPDVLFEGGFSVDPSSNLAYLVEEPTLHTVNLTTGAFSMIGNLIYNGAPLGSATNVDGLAFRGSELYGIVTIQTPGLNGHLVRIDKNTGVVTDVGPTGVMPGSPAGLTYDPVRDVFYLAAQDLSGFYRLNPHTGAATPIGNATLPEISGLAFIPEPSTWFLAVAGAAVLLRRSKAARAEHPRSACMIRLFSRHYRVDASVFV